MPKALKLVLIILLPAIAACASLEEPEISDKSLTETTATDECYCSVRKRHQVESRIKKKAELAAD